MSTRFVLKIQSSPYPPPPTHPQPNTPQHKTRVCNTCGADHASHRFAAAWVRVRAAFGDGYRTGSCVICETTPTGCPRSRPRVSPSIHLSISHPQRGRHCLRAVLIKRGGGNKASQRQSDCTFAGDSVPAQQHVLREVPRPLASPAIPLAQCMCERTQQCPGGGPPRLGASALRDQGHGM